MSNVESTTSFDYGELFQSVVPFLFAAVQKFSVFSSIETSICLP